MICCVRRPPRQNPGGRAVIKMRRAQLSFGDGLIAEEVGDLCEDWMKHVDQVLEDEQLVAAVYEALARRHPMSRSRGREGTPAAIRWRWANSFQGNRGKESGAALQDEGSA